MENLPFHCSHLFRTGTSVQKNPTNSSTELSTEAENVTNIHTSPVNTALLNTRSLKSRQEAAYF